MTPNILASLKFTWRSGHKTGIPKHDSYRVTMMLNVMHTF